MDTPRRTHERDSIFWRSINIKKGMLSSLEVSVYFEKHKILDIITKILFEISIERPGNAAKWLSENIRRIANEFVCTRTFLLTPNGFDLNKFSEYYQKKFNVPTIIYKGKGCRCPKDILKKLESFLKKYNLNNKNKIFINFPENCQQLNAFQEHLIKPSNIFEIKSDPKETIETCCLLEDFVKKQNYESIHAFYKDIYHIIHYGSRDTAPNRLQTVEEIATKLSSLMEFSNMPIDRLIKSDFRYRIIIYGSRGSGQKSHAMSIAKRFNLVPLFATQIIAAQIQQPSGIGNALRNRLLHNNELSLLSEAAAIQCRLLQTDCIQHGWVLMDYPYNKEGFKILIERQLMPPNRILIFHCRRKLALRRLQKGWTEKYNNNNDSIISQNYMKYVEAEMNYVSLQKHDVYNYLNKKEIKCIHIDGNHSFRTVQKEIWGNLEQNQTKISSVHAPTDTCFPNEIV